MSRAAKGLIVSAWRPIGRTGDRAIVAGNDGTPRIASGAPVACIHRRSVPAIEDIVHLLATLAGHEG